MLLVLMQEEYPYTQLEYAKILGLSKSGLISRRKAGKLEGEYILKDNQYFFKRLRPNQVNHTPKTYSKQRRRGVHLNGEKTKYTSWQFKQHNEMKMLAKLKHSVDDETLALLPEALIKAKELKQERIDKTRSDASRSNINRTPTKNYGSGIYDPRTVPPIYTSLKPKTKKKFTYYY